MAKLAARVLTPAVPVRSSEPAGIDTVASGQVVPVGNELIEALIEKVQALEKMVEAQGQAMPAEPTRDTRPKTSLKQKVRRRTRQVFD